MRASFAEEKERTIYSRYSNPNTSEWIEKVCKMEGAEDGFAFASGMAAVFSTFAALLNSGDHVVSSRSVFGSTHTLFTQVFPKWNISHSYFRYEPVWRRPRRSSARKHGSSMRNRLRIPEWMCWTWRPSGNWPVSTTCCWSSTIVLPRRTSSSPSRFGADLVIHSGTKLMDGQGRVLAGITVGSRELIDRVYRFSRITGPALSPFNAWLLSKSMETLAVRVDRHCENALKIAEFLSSHPKVNWVKYPFLKTHPQYELAKKQMKAGGCVVGL